MRTHTNTLIHTRTHASTIKGDHGFIKNKREKRKGKWYNYIITLKKLYKYNYLISLSPAFLQPLSCPPNSFQTHGLLLINYYCCIHMCKKIINVTWWVYLGLLVWVFFFFRADYLGLDNHVRGSPLGKKNSHWAVFNFL